MRLFTFCSIVALIFAGGILASIALVGCGTGQPSCADNPRNMQCMSAEQLQKELNQ